MLVCAILKRYDHNSSASLSCIDFVSVLLKVRAFKAAGSVLEQFGVTENPNGRYTEFYKWLAYLFSPRFPVTNTLQLGGLVIKINKSMLVHNY